MAKKIPVFPPGPRQRLPGSSLITLITLRRDPLAFLSRIAREYGDIAHFRLGSLHAYLLSHPDYIKDVLVTHARIFHKGLGLQRAKRLLGEGLLTSEDDLHLRQRRLAQPAFHRQRIAAYADVMSHSAHQTSLRWAREGPGERDVHREMMRLTLAIVGKTLFDAEVEAEADEIRDALTDSLELFERITLPFGELLEKILPGMKRRFRHARGRLDATIYRMIEERRAGGCDRGDLLSMLLLAQDTEGDGGGMSDEQLRDECMTIFLAGHETTANALAFTWYLLSQHPEVEARLHAEADSVLGDRLPAFEDLPCLRYTEMVLAEAMRLYPPAWTLGRTAMAEYQVAGYTVPKGSLLLMSQWVMHRDPRYFPEPERFDPERWSKEARESRPRFCYFPFGAGPRVCIGESFAWMEGVLVLATLARHWRMRLAPGQRLGLRPLVTLRPSSGMRMMVAARTAHAYAYSSPA